MIRPSFRWGHGHHPLIVAVSPPPDPPWASDAVAVPATSHRSQGGRLGEVPASPQAGRPVPLGAEDESISAGAPGAPGVALKWSFPLRSQWCQ